MFSQRSEHFLLHNFILNNFYNEYCVYYSLIYCYNSCTTQTAQICVRGSSTPYCIPTTITTTTTYTIHRTMGVKMGDAEINMTGLLY